MRPRHALVLGLGRFGGGVAVTRHLAAQGFRVTVSDPADPDTLAESIAAVDGVPRVDLVFGPQETALLDGIDLLVCNPAVRPDHSLPLAAKRRGIAVTQEVNLFLEQYPGRVLAVTGTNGKSSTATLLANILRRHGTDTLLGGNIGRSLLLDADRWHRDQVAVLEISSFQLERVDPLVHRVFGTLFTRVTEDHLDRHGSVTEYHRTKSVAAQMADEFVAFAHDDAAAGFAHHAEATLPYAGPRNTITVHADRLLSHSGTDRGHVLDAAAMRMVGSFQLENAAGALTAALATDPRITRHGAAVALARTEPLPYRLQLKATVGGVRIFDNSVSTQVDSTLSALDGLAALAGPAGRVHWVGGGKSKDGRFREPGDRLGARVTSAHLFGSAGPELGTVLRERVPTTVHEDLGAALDAAYRECRAGDALLFSPAFASFDQYPNFQARAARFADWVRHMADSPTNH